MKKLVFLCSIIGVFIVFLSSITLEENPAYIGDPSSLDDCTFMPIEMPSKLANGHNFPTDSNTIQRWVDNSFAINGLETNRDIISHAWGLWQAITEMTDQTCNGQQMRRFETWYTPQDIMRATESGSGLPLRLNHKGHIHVRPKFAAASGGFHDNNISVSSGDISGKVKYNPAGAISALENRYFDADAMRARVRTGVISKIELSNSTVTLKPIYRVLTDNFLVYNDLYRFHVWGGKSDGGKQVTEFENYVYVSKRPNDPRIDNVNIFSINSFIYHRMSKEEAEVYNRTNPKEGNELAVNIAKEGDIVILLGSHLATREDTRWTWQTFFWSPNPDNPRFPSSRAMAAGRRSVKDLDSPANHYAVSLGYSMLSPAAPNNLEAGIRTDNRGSVYALNPYIEGTFTFDDVFPGQEKLYDQYGLGFLYKPRNVDGLTSSCMGCHSQAHYAGQGRKDIGKAVALFVADQYVPRNAPWFIGKLQTDFAWSLSGVFEQPPCAFEEQPDKGPCD